MLALELESHIGPQLTEQWCRAIGQSLIMGWDGTEVTPQIRSLIEEHHLGSIILTAKNLKCESSARIDRPDHR